MDKWADYLIREVHYSTDSSHHHIEEVRASEDEGNQVSSDKISFSKDKVIQDISSNSATFMTTFLENNKWKQGKKVIVERIDNVNYIKYRSKS